MSQPTRPLIEVLAEIEDTRQARGKRHPLVALLATMGVGSPCHKRFFIDGAVPGHLTNGW